MQRDIIAKLGTLMEHAMGYLLVTPTYAWQGGNRHARSCKRGLHISQTAGRNAPEFDGCLVTSYGSGQHMSVSHPLSILNVPIHARALAYTPYLRGAELPELILDRFWHIVLIDHVCGFHISKRIREVNLLAGSLGVCA